jgi:hypothetical protein
VAGFPETHGHLLKREGTAFNSQEKRRKVGDRNAGNVIAAEPSGANLGLNLPEQHESSLWVN